MILWVFWVTELLDSRAPGGSIFWWSLFCMGRILCDKRQPALGTVCPPWSQSVRVAARPLL